MMRITKSLYFKRFPYIFPVKGYKRSLLFNSVVNKIEFISNEFYDLIISLETNSLLIANEKSGMNRSKFSEIVKQLVDTRVGFICGKSDFNLFPSMDTRWLKPSFITNAIIDYNKLSNYNLSGVINELLKLHCLEFLFRFFCSVKLSFLYKLLKNFSDTYVSKIELIIKDDKFSLNEIIQLIYNYPRLKSILIHSSDRDEVKIQSCCNIVFSKTIISDNSFCGSINLFNICLSRDLYTESLTYNSCLNRKVGIDVDGDIKNCPSMKHCFGNVQCNSISDVIGKFEFQQMWMINKDQIDICKDCEFRYFCIDCRAFILNENIYSAPLKCKYDPYTARWC